MESFELYDFIGGKLDKHLDKILKGKRIKHEREWIRKEVKAISLEQANIPHSTLKFEGNGIFREVDGQWQRRFVYLYRYHIKKHGRLPVRHFYECETVKKYKSFVLGNTDLVDITCRVGGEPEDLCTHCNQKTCGHDTHRDQNLSVCKHCIREFRNQTGLSLEGKSIAEVILDYEEYDKTKMTKVGRNGYVLNWQDISTAYRTVKQYRCESCKVDLSAAKNWHLLQVHHCNYDKLDNSRDNLKALCIACHAEVDAHHRKQFSDPHSQSAIRQVEKIREIQQSAQGNHNNL